MEDMYDANGNYRFLPRQFRDFHNQKDLFKAIYRDVEYEGLPIPDVYKIPWVTMQVNVVDIFLYNMALRGYTLQKDRRFL